jgi:V/A-type H+-transporting ATPase subunit I
MAIVPLKRVTLIGELKHRDNVLRSLQRLGCIHVVDLNDNGDRIQGTTLRSEELKSAIAYLKRCPEKRPASSGTGVGSEPSSSVDHGEVKQVAEQVLQIESESRELADERDLVTEKIEQIRPWGNFHLPTGDELRGRKLYFYRLKHREAHQLPASVESDVGAYRINSDAEHEYWMFVAEDAPADMPSEPEEFDARSLAELESRLDEIGEQQERLQLRRIALTRWLDPLRRETGSNGG